MVGNRAELHHPGSLNAIVSLLARGAVLLWLLVPGLSVADEDGLGKRIDTDALELTPAWAGHVRPGYTSALVLRLRSSRGGQAQAVLEDTRVRVRSQLTIEPGRTVEVTLPLPYAAGRSPRLLLSIDDASLEREIPLQPLAPDTRLVAVVTAGQPLQWPRPGAPPAKTVIVRLGAAELPATPQAYRQLDALVLSQAAIDSLSRDQEQAIAAYLGDCGTLYLPARLAGEGGGARSAAGCGGRHVMPLGELPEDAASLPRREHLSVSTLLRELQHGSPAGAFRALAVFLAAYLGLLIVLARARPGAWLLLGPPAAAVLTLLGWSLSRPVVGVSAWAEMSSGDPVARYAAMVQINGTSRGQFTLPLPAQTGVPTTTATDDIVFDTDTAGARATVPVRLLSQQQLLLRGVMPAPQIDVRDTPDGVLVRNRSGQPLAAGIAAWRGQRYSFPRLESGASWQSVGEAESWSSDPAEAQLRQRALDGGSWVLARTAAPRAFADIANPDAAVWMLVQGLRDDR